MSGDLLAEDARWVGARCRVLRVKWALGTVITLALSIGLLMLLAFPRAPSGIHWPQHTGWGASPLAGFLGVLRERDGCFYVETSPDEPGYLVIWPMFASVSRDTEGPVIRIDGRSIRPGEEIALVGGEYGHGPLPEIARAALSVPCDGPYMLTTGLYDE